VGSQAGRRNPAPAACPARAGRLRSAVPPGEETRPFRMPGEPLGDAAAARILESLNEAQVDAVTHDRGPLLIVAGAGTGKTTLLTRRIAYLIATRPARPQEVLALTFTHKAALEMGGRGDVLGPSAYPHPRPPPLPTP